MRKTLFQAKLSVVLSDFVATKSIIKKIEKKDNLFSCNNALRCLPSLGVLVPIPWSLWPELLEAWLALTNVVSSISLHQWLALIML